MKKHLNVNNMNYGISILFRAIPLVMGLICFFYGGYVFLAGGPAGSNTAGPVIFFLGSICLTLYATAATIIRQLIHTYNKTVRLLLPVMGYAVAITTLVIGIVMFIRQPVSEFAVAGHIVAGLGLICMCVSTAATSSTRFTLIPINSSEQRPAYGAKAKRNTSGFTRGEESLMIAFTACVAAAAWVWAIVLLAHSPKGSAYLVAGCVMAGLACICTSLVALVASISRQIDNTYTERERSMWVGLVLAMASIAFVWGLVMIFLYWGQTVNFVGFVMIGLSMVCFSISSKVLLLAKSWKADFPLASRVPLIPVMTALACLFLSIFLYEEALFHVKYFVPSRVIAGLGAVCFTLFSIVSILESGAKKH